MEKKNFFVNTKYQKEYDKAQIASNFASSRPSTKLESDVNNILSSISGVNLIEYWSDSASDLFNKSKSNCLSSLDNILASVNSTFKKSEEVYQLLFTQLDYLKTTDEVYQSTFALKPIKSEYQETVTNSITNQTYTRTKDSYYVDLEKWEKSILELEKSCREMQSQIDEYISLLDQINGMTLSTKSKISIPSLIQPKTTNIIDFVDFVEFVDKSIIGEDYEFDIVVDFEGKKYIAFAQGGTFGESNSQLKNTRFAYTDGAGATSISGAACSMCSLLNGLSNMLGIEKVAKSFGLDTSNLNYKDDSLNSTLLIGINEKAKSLGETSNKLKGIEQICDNYFKDDVEVKPTTLASIKKEELDKIHEGNAFAVVRLGKNSSDKYSTGGGHYIVMIDYDKETNKGLFIDSAVRIDKDDSTFNSHSSKSTERTRLSWGILEKDGTKETALESVLNGKRGAENYDYSINKDGYNLILISKK